MITAAGSSSHCPFLCPGVPLMYHIKLTSTSVAAKPEKTASVLEKFCFSGICASRVSYKVEMVLLPRGMSSLQPESSGVAAIWYEGGDAIWGRPAFLEGVDRLECRSSGSKAHRETQTSGALPGTSGGCCVRCNGAGGGRKHRNDQSSTQHHQTDRHDKRHPPSQPRADRPPADTGALRKDAGSGNRRFTEHEEPQRKVPGDG